MTEDLTYQTARVESKSKEGSWSSAFEFAPPSASEKSTRGVLLAAASVESGDKFDAELAGHQILSALQETYYTQVTGGILPALEKAVVAAHQRLITLVFSGEEGGESVDFNLVVGVLWGSVFYLAQLGEARAVILRGGGLKLIGHRKEASESELSVDEKPDVRTASGMLESGDKIVLGTPKFFDGIPAPELEAAVTSGGATYIAEKLNTKFAEKPAAAALVLTLGQDQESGGGIEEPGEEPTAEAVTVEPVAVAEAVAVSEDEAGNVTVEATQAEAAVVTAEDSGSEVEGIGEADEDKEAELPSEARPGGGWGERAQAAGVVGLGVARKTLPVVRNGVRSGVKLVQAAGIPALLKRTFGTLWDSLGKPRTAVEGVSDAKNRRTLLVLAGAALLILLIGIGINSLGKSGTNNKDRFNSLMTAAQAEYNEAQTDISTAPNQAKTLLATAQDNLNQAKALNVDPAQVSSLQDKINVLLDQANQVYHVTPTVLADLTTVRIGASGIDLAGDPNNLYVLDPSGGLYQVAVATGKITTLSSDISLNKGQNLFLLGSDLFTYVPGQGVWGYDLKKGKLTESLKVDPSWGTISDWTSYTAYVYALDSGKSQILRYAPGSTTQFGKSYVWLKAGTTDLTGSTSISVDGSIWVAQGGQVLKFVKGAPEAFALTGVTPAPTAIRAVYTTPDETNLYLLESGRLLVTDKTGAYIGQYLSDKLNGATSLIVDEIGKKAYVLSGGFIYTITLH